MCRTFILKENWLHFCSCLKWLHSCNSESDAVMLRFKVKRLFSPVCLHQKLSLAVVDSCRICHRQLRLEHKTNAIIPQQKISRHKSDCHLLWVAFLQVQQSEKYHVVDEEAGHLCNCECLQVQKSMLTQVTALRSLILHRIFILGSCCYLPPVLVFVLRSVGVWHCSTAIL